MSKVKVAVLYGGRSGEHEVSQRSAASVLTYLNPEKHVVIPIGMDKQGQCFINNYQEMLQYPDGLPVQTALSKALPSLLVNGRLGIDADVIFPIAHGPLYEDGALQGLLELSDTAYVGCGVLSSALGMDKDIARRIACGDEVQSTRYRMIPPSFTPAEITTLCDEVVRDFGWPLFVKPCCLGSSVGIHKVGHFKALNDAIADAKRYDTMVMIEAFAKGREIELAVLEDVDPHKPPRVSIPGEVEVLHPDGFYSYSAKYLESDQTLLHIPATLKPQTIERLQSISAKIFTRLRCRGMARVDFFVNETTDKIYFNEINTLPGFTSISMYPKLWEASGLAYSDLLEHLVKLAQYHKQCRDNLVTDYS